MRRRSDGGGSFALKLTLGILIVAIVWMTWHNMSGMFGSGSDKAALKAVRQFYGYEQVGDFGSAWELFHPLMQAKFAKSAYIQSRARIFMQDLGVKSFEFTTGQPEHLTSWKMDGSAAELTDVYKIVVTETFHSPFGHFDIVQPCYAAYEQGSWRVLWSYDGTDSQDIPQQ